MKEVAKKEMWSRLKEIFKRRICMSRRQLNATEVATSLRCHDVDPSMKPQERYLQENEVATNF